MNIEYFESFMETARQKSLSKASERLNITQPALSKQIRKIEDYFDSPLLIRSTSGVELTEAGEIVFNRIPNILDEITRIQNELKQLSEIRSIKIGTLPSLAGNYIPSKIVKLKENGIDAEVMIKNTSSEVYELLKKGELDAAIIETIPTNGSFWKMEIFTEPLYAIVHTSHQLSRKESVYLEELAEEEFVLYPSNCKIRQAISSAVKNLNIRTEVEFGGFLIGYVAAGGGVTVVPEISAKNSGNPLVKAIPILNPDMKRQISMIAQSKSTGKFLYPFFKEKKA